MKMKFTIIITAFLLSIPALGCWYNRISYNDYIFGVNNFERHSEATVTKGPDGKALTEFTV